MSKRHGWLVIAVLLWGTGVASGVGLLWRYKATPGAAADAPSGWPSNSAIPRSAGAPSLVMLAHPFCPCTRASLDELAVVMARLPRVSAHVLFLTEPDTGFDWEHSRSWNQARAIPGVTVLPDPGGVEAARFGATVSGQTVVYDPAGRLIFSGGITGARGHVGDNLGERRLLSAALPGAPSASIQHSAVYGCPLSDTR